MTRSLPLLAGAVALALAACDNNATHVDGGSGSAATDVPNSSGQSEALARGMASTQDGAPDAGTLGEARSMLADADRSALMAVAEVDRHEIAASELALSKDVQGPVRDYAETLQRDHTRNLEATRALLGPAAGTGETMTTVAGGTAATTRAATGADTRGEAGDAPPDVMAMQRKHEAQHQTLAALDGAEFQRAWVDAMVTGHQEALDKLDSELIPSADDARVQRHLQTSRTAIAGHLETARGLQQAP